MARNPNPKSTSRRFQVELFEPRLLLSADALGLAGIPGMDIERDDEPWADNDDLIAGYDSLLQLADSPSPGNSDGGGDKTGDTDPVEESFSDSDDGTTQLLFVDTTVDDYETLIDQILEDNKNENISIYLIDGARDGIDQITGFLAHHSDIDALHLISHGSPGNLQLGSSVLNAANLANYSGALHSWGQSLSENADLLIYGCDVAAGDSGAALVNAMGTLAGADVAASIDPTGSAIQGGDWDLEYQSGLVEAATFASGSLQSWQGTLASFTVDTTFDTVDLAPGDGVAEDASGNTSLRAAIMEANALPGADTIFLDAEQYKITLSGPGEGGGDLNIRSDLSIVGVSPSQTVIDGGNNHRVFNVADNAAHTVSLSALEIDRGASPIGANGGGLRVQGAANTPDVYLDNVRFDKNNASGAGAMGGAISNAGNLTITNTLIEGNTAPEGGGVWNASTGTLFMENVTLSGNEATVGDGGGLFNEGTATLRHVTVTNNTAAGNGGGIIHDNIAVTTDIGNSIIAGNTAPFAPDISSTIGAITSSGGNIVQDASGASGFAAPETGIDPLLGLLLDNGGDLMTHAPAAPEAIDKADPSMTPNTDQRGFLRGDGSPDIGAYEASASAAGTADYLDQFNAIAYNGDDGALSWANDWQEIGEADGASFGNMSVYNKLGEQGLYLWFTNNIGVWRQANLSGATEATLSFDWAMFKTELNDSASLQISTDGVVWDTLDTFDGPLDHSTLQFATYDISAYIDDDTRIKFETVSGFGSNDVLFVDNVRIELSTPPPAVTTLSPIKDTYLDKISPNDVNNYGTDTLLHMHEKGTGFGEGHVLLQFDLGSLPANATITGATLQLEAVGKTDVLPTDSSIIGVYEVTEAWDEGSGGSNNDATWKERQTGTAWSTEGGSIDPTPIASLESSAIGGHTWDITTLVQDWQTGAKTNNGLMLASEDSGEVIFTYDSREGTTPPQLIITYTVPYSAPVFQNDGPFTLDEGVASGTLVGDIDADDGDGGAVDAGITYDIIANLDPDGDGNKAFFIDSNSGVITVNDADDLDYETAHPMVITVEADDGTKKANTAVTINLNNINEAPTVSVPTSIFINEIHYDNMGVDVGEAIEIAGVAGNELNSWSLVLYSGFDGSVYDTVDLSGILPNQADNFGTLAFNFPSNGIQNATPDPDGIALVDPMGTVVQFLSYEGTFFATEGPANGILSTDIVVSEDNGTTPVGHSLQLTGPGPVFGWAAASANTFGSINTGQDFSAISAATSQTINEDTSLVFSSGNGNAITVDDVDAAFGGADPVSVKLDVSNGTLTLADTADLGSVTGDGSNSVVFTGTTAELNTAMEGLIYQPDPHYSGNDVLTVLVNDQGNSGSGGNQVVNAAVYITVDPLNDDPTITSTAITAANEDSAYSYTFTVNDVDAGDTLTLSAPTLPAWLSFDTGTGILSGTPTNAEVGTHNVVLRVNDGTVDVDQSFTITVSNTNDDPTITSTAITAANEDSAYSYTFTVNDVDAGDTLTLSAPTLPAWLSFDTGTGVLSGTPTNAEVGTHNVVLRVNDGTVDVDQSFTITVSNTNDDPTITSTAITAANEDSAYSYTFTVNDVDAGDTLTLSAPTLTAWLSFDTGTGILSGTPTNAEVGTHNVVLRVDDGTVDVDQSFTITVSNTNDDPTITSTAITAANEDSAYSYTFTVNDVDAGDTLTLSAPTLPAWLSFDTGTGILSGTPTNAEVGTHNVVLRVNDGTVDVDQSFTITVSNTNDDPTITSTAITAANEDSAYSYTFTVNDVDAGDTLTLSAPTLPAWLSFDTGTGILSGTPTNAEVGTHNVVLRVNDGTVDVDQSFTITVSNTNDDPTITSTAITAANEDSAYSYTFTVNDVDAGDTLTLSAPTLPAWLSFDTGTGILSGTPTNAEVGTHNVVLRVNDGTVDVDQSFTITVSNTNDDPTITSTAITAANEDSAYSYTFTVNDVDAGDTLTLSAPTLPAWLSFDTGTGILSGTPTNAEVGTHNVVLRVNDGTVDVDQSFTITVSNTNDDPTITSTAITAANEDSAYSYTFTVNDVDAGDTLTLSAPTLPAWLSFDTGTGILSGTPTNAEVGTHNVVLRVNDGTVDVDQSFTITVSNTNDDPTITSTAITAANEDSAYSYTFTVNDVDAGDTLTLSAPTLPAWLSFDTGTGILSGTPTNAEVGTHNVVLRVNDGTVDVDQSFTITVSNTNDDPTITSTAVTAANEDSAYSYTFTVNDVDASDTLTLSAPTLPAWLSFDTGTGILSGTPTNAEVGTHNVVLRVNDGTVDVDQSFTITVSNTNDDPTITSTAITAANEDSAYSYTFTVNDVDAGDTLTLSAPTLPAWLSFDTGTGVLSGTPTNAEVGTHNVVLRVNDGTVDVDQSFTITVSNTNDDPTITSTAITAANEDSAYSYTFTVNDVDAGDTLTLSAPTLTAWLSFDTGTGILSGTPTNAEVGTHNVVLRVDDGTVDVDQSFTITVSNTNDDPTITSTAITAANEDSAYSYTFTVNDVDAGDTLTLSAPTLPAWLSFDTGTGVLSGTPTNAEVGTHNVVLRVNDGTVDVDQVFTITVSNVNDAPALGNNSLNLNNGQTVIISSGMLSASDVDHPDPSLTFIVSGVSGGQFEQAAAPGVAINSYTQAEVTAGQILFVDDGDSIAPAYSIIVSDGISTTGPNDATITLNPPAPVIEPVSTPAPAPVPVPVIEPMLPTIEVSESTPEEEIISNDTLANESPQVMDEQIGDTGVQVQIETPVSFGSGGSVPDIDTRISGDSSANSLQALLRTLVSDRIKPAVIAEPNLHENLGWIAMSEEVRAMLASSEFNNDLDRVREDVSEVTLFRSAIVGSGAAVTTSLSVGYVAWLIRGGVLLSTMLSSLPAWQIIDPLPVLGRSRDGSGEKDGDDGDSLESIIKNQSSEVDKEEGKAPVDKAADDKVDAPQAIS